MDDPVFNENITCASLEKERHLTMKQIKALVEMNFKAQGPDKELYKVIPFYDVVKHLLNEHDDNNVIGRS